MKSSDPKTYVILRWAKYWYYAIWGHYVGHRGIMPPVWHVDWTNNCFFSPLDKIGGAAISIQVSYRLLDWLMEQSDKKYFCLIKE